MESLTEIIAVLDAQIAARKSLSAQMVGQLYPSMLEAEIRKLQAARACLTN